VKDDITKLSLFSGIMGDDLASEWAGIKTVCCVENDPFCQAVIKKHYPDMPIIGDIHDVTKEILKELTGHEWVDIIAGGYPCQGESQCGKRGGTADNRWLWGEMRRIIHELKPTWVVCENVANHVNMGMPVVLSDLESEGYETQAFSIPACGVGLSTMERHVWIIAKTISIRRQGCENIKDSNDRIKREFPRTDTGVSDRWALPESRVCRSRQGVPHLVDRLRGLANAVPPLLAYPIYKAIVEVERII